MNILFDRFGAQAAAQLQYGNRLTGLFENITNAGYTYEITPDPGTLTSPVLNGFDVLVLTTRMQQPYSTSELSAITNFVSNGGGLWCMANHAGFNLGMINDNFLRYVSAVSSTYWSAYEATAYQSKISGSTPVNLSGTNLAAHPTIVGQAGWPLAIGSSSVSVSQVVTRSFCGVYANAFSDPVCNLENLNVINAQNGDSVTQGVGWAIAMKNSSLTNKGRVVVGADSGWLGDTDSRIPGPGEFQNGDNAQYALNTLSWLGGA